MREPRVQRYLLIGQRTAALDARQLERLFDLRFQAVRILQQPSRQRRPLLALRDRFGLPISDEDVAKIPFLPLPDGIPTSEDDWT